MNKKITIKRIARKEIAIKNGPRAGTTSWKIGVQDEEGNWYNAWASAWNQDWKEGQVIELEYEETKFGNEIKPPQSSRGFQNNNTQLMSEIAEMKAMIEEIYRKILNSPEPTQTNEEPPF